MFGWKVMNSREGLKWKSEIDRTVKGVELNKWKTEME